MRCVHPILKRNSSVSVQTILVLFVLALAAWADTKEISDIIWVVSWFGPAVRCYAGKQKGLSLIPLWLPLLFKKVVVCRHCLVALSLTINETLKWLSSLPILMQESFWWWQCSASYIISLSATPTTTLFSPPFIISLMVSVDIKQYVYILCNLSYQFLHTHHVLCKALRAF